MDVGVEPILEARAALADGLHDSFAFPTHHRPEPWLNTAKQVTPGALHCPGMQMGR